jgi:uncharacterized protein YdeI (YjbR/CyaY-like superfamily)
MPSRPVPRAAAKLPNSKRPRTTTALDQLYVADRASWRRWLARHHASSPGVWLIFDKATHREDRLPYADAVEEALCVGWIDSTVRPLSAAQYQQLFTPRKPRSTWSKVNKARVERLIQARLMRPAGLAAIARAKENGAWESLDHVEALTVPPDLVAALEATAGASEGFAALSPSARKGYLHWVHQAKRLETRARRVAAVVDFAVARRRSRHV